MRILFTTVGLSGHFFPSVPLAWALRARGHDVLIGCADGFSEAAVHSGLPVAPCGPADRFADLAARDGAAMGTDERRRVHGRVFGRLAVQILPGMRRLVSTWRPDLIVSERAEAAGPLTAAAHGVPLVEMHWGVAPLYEYRQATAAELHTDRLPDPDLVLNPWPPSLRKPHALGHHSIRTVAYSGPARVAAWMLRPRSRPTICVSLGTVLPDLSDDLVGSTLGRIVGGLAALDVDVIVAVDDDVAAGLPELPAGVVHVGWLPLPQVFAVCDLVVHHGGQGTTLAALSAGRAQLVLPQFDDQFDNATAVAEAGAGLTLTADELRESEVTRRCTELLGRQRYRHAAAEIAAEIAEQPSPADVAGALEELG